MFESQCRSWSSEPELADVKRLLGVHKYKDMSKVRPIILESALKAAEKAKAICKPDARFRVVRISKIGDDDIALVGGHNFSCSAFSHHLASCSHVLIFAITLGAELDDAVSDGFSEGNDPLGPLFLDTAGWITVESSTRRFVAEQKALLAKESFKMTLRLAPGYSFAMKGKGNRTEWPLTDQKSLFDALECEDLPIELLESFAMLPKMSRSGMFGIRPKTPA